MWVTLSQTYLNIMLGLKSGYCYQTAHLSAYIENNNANVFVAKNKTKKPQMCDQVLKMYFRKCLVVRPPPPCRLSL